MHGFKFGLMTACVSSVSLRYLVCLNLAVMERYKIHNSTARSSPIDYTECSLPGHSFSHTSVSARETYVCQLEKLKPHPAQSSPTTRTGAHAKYSHKTDHNQCVNFFE